MINPNINSFSLKWIKENQIELLSDQYSEAEAFQKICGSILNSKIYKEETGSDLKFMSFPLYGKDGSIDHYSFTDSESAIVECKKNNSAKNCISEIKKLHKKLANSLSKNNAANTDYSPWFRESMQTYIFCTSCNVSSAKEFHTIRDEITAMMINLASIQGLSHLKDLKIAVYCWNNLKEWLMRSDDLMLEWVKTGIEGVEEIFKDARPYEGYHAYLLSSKIPYCSRDEFMDQHPNITDLPSEKNILSALVLNEASNKKGIIIHGQGGIGKTRFMRELALMAKPEGWRSYLVRTTDGFKQLNQVFKAGGKYLILIDYIEEFERFYQVIISFARENHNYSFKFIVNCRSSYFKSNEKYLSNILHPVDISNATPSTQLYYNDLINKIIKDIPNLNDINNTIFEHKPSFAVFIRYLYETNKEQYYNPAKFSDFRSWLARRLELSFTGHNNKSYDKDLVTKIFCCLPAHSTGRNFLEEEYMPEINILMADGWFEKKPSAENEYILSTIHDTIADELLIDYLSRYSHTLNKAIENHWFFAINSDLLTGCIRSYERICDNDLLAGFNFQSLLQLLTERYPDKMSQAYVSMAFSSLLPLEYRIELLVREYPIFSSIVESEEFGSIFCYFLERLIKKEISEECRSNLYWIYDKWYTLHKDNYFNHDFSPFLVWDWLMFDGITPKTSLITEHYLQNTNIKHTDYFVFFFWLHNGGEPGVVEWSIIKWLEMTTKTEDTYSLGFLPGTRDQKETLLKILKILNDWLNKHINNKEYKQFSFAAIITWLSESEQKAIATSYAYTWLENYGDTDIYGGALLKACLKAGIDRASLLPHMINWLNKFAETDYAKNVLKAWLDARGQTATVLPYLTIWLKQFGHTQDAIEVMICWLQAEGETDITKQYIPYLLNEFLNTEHAVTLIGVWLIKSDDPAFIADAVEKWQSTFANTEFEGFVLAQWLKVGGNVNIVTDAVIKWLTKYVELENSYVLLLNWMGAGGPHSVILPFVDRWLELFPRTENWEKVISAWFGSGGGHSLLAPRFPQMIENFGDSWEVVNLLIWWLDFNKETSVPAAAITKWLQLYSEKEQAGHLLISWINAAGDKETIDTATKQWLKVNWNTELAGALMCSWMGRYADKTIVSPYIMPWLEKFDSLITGMVLAMTIHFGTTPDTVSTYVKNWLTKYDEPAGAMYLIVSWLKGGGELTLVSAFIPALLVKAADKQEAGPLLVFWLKRGGDKNLVSDYIDPWLNKFNDLQLADELRAEWDN